MDIVIVGAGFSGVALTRALVRQAVPGTRIALIGHAGSFGRGVAYGTPRLEHSLNVRARDLGIDPDLPAGFADWLALQSPEREGFQPRTHYGDYLCAMLDEVSAHAAARGIALHLIHDDLTSVSPTAAGFHCQCGDGDRIEAARVVLAIGALPPQPMTSLSGTLVNSPHYIATPFAGAALDRIAADANVFIIGTGLTFADVAISLRRNGHRGRIEAISRHGLAPLPHLVEPAPPLALSLPLQAALDAGELRAIVRRLREAAREADDWRRVLDAMRPHTQLLWQRMDLRSRSRFLRHLRTYWEIHRHRLAPQLLDELDAMRHSGQLEIRTSRLMRGDLCGDHARLTLRDRGSTRTRDVDVDVVIRATGLDSDIQRTGHGLIAQLRDAGLACADDLGLGLHCDADFAVLDPHRRPVPGLFALGPLLRGQLWEITAVPELRRAAITLADRLLHP